MSPSVTAMTIWEAGHDDEKGGVGMTNQRAGSESVSVMAGLVPAIHVFLALAPSRRGCRHKAGQDEVREVLR